MGALFRTEPTALVEESSVGNLRCLLGWVKQAFLVSTDDGGFEFLSWRGRWSEFGYLTSTMGVSSPDAGYITWDAVVWRIGDTISSST